jgi:hypothetical protein
VAETAFKSAVETGYCVLLQTQLDHAHQGESSRFRKEILAKAASEMA